MIENSQINTNKSSDAKWVPLVSAILAGWNVGLLATFLSMIGISLFLKQIYGTIKAGSGPFMFIIAVAVVVGIIVAGYSGKKLFGWFKNRTLFVAYSLMFFLIIITILSFPSSFTYIQ